MWPVQEEDPRVHRSGTPTIAPITAQNPRLMLNHDSILSPSVNTFTTFDPPRVSMALVEGLSAARAELACERCADLDANRECRVKGLAYGASIEVPAMRV
jgi:hypothetical protein